MDSALRCAWWPSSVVSRISTCWPGKVSLPGSYVQQKALYARRFDADVAHLSQLPFQPPPAHGRGLNHRHISALSRGRRKREKLDDGEVSPFMHDVAQGRR